MVYPIDMYIRTVTRDNKNGTTTEYLQLAHNEWDKEKKRSNVNVLFNLGRKEEVDVKALERLVASIQKIIDPSAHLKTVNGTLEILSAKVFGGAWFLDQLWKRLGIGSSIRQLLSEREFEIPIERAIFAMVANRVLEPGSKLSAEHWVNECVYIPSLPEVSVHQLYRSMDFLLEHDAKIQEDVFFSVASVMNLEVDLIYFDTTSTYFEIENPDESNGNGSNEDALRQYGHSKDHRADLPQAVIGMAVTKEGIPIRCWVFSGETADVSVVEQVKKDLNGWKLGRVVSVMDRGFASDDNFVKLQIAGGHYIIGEKMRAGKPDVTAAMSKKGPFTKLRENLQYKECIVGDGERRVCYVIVFNPAEAEKNRLTREKHIKTLEEELKKLGDLEGKVYTKTVCALVAHRVYKRYLKTLESGKLIIDKAKIAAEEKLDGKYLIRTSDDSLSPADIVLGYKQLMDIERGFRTLKTDLELRPVYHRTSDRIKAHVLLCWLALLLIRVAENETGKTWFNLDRALDPLKLIMLRSPDGTVSQCTAISVEQKSIFSACKLQIPAKILGFGSADH